MTGGYSVPGRARHGHGSRRARSPTRPGTGPEASEAGAQADSVPVTFPGRDGS